MIPASIILTKTKNPVVSQKGGVIIKEISAGLMDDTPEELIALTKNL